MQSQTLIEIFEQPAAWRAVIDYMNEVHGDLFKYLQQKVGSEVVFVGCGTSYYLAMSAASIFSAIANRKARAVPSSDVFIFPESIFPSNSDYFVVLISRSGKTTETKWAARYIKEKMNIETLALTCYPANDLVEICDRALVAKDASEQSVVMTKSFTSMLLLCTLMACVAVESSVVHDDILKLPDLAESVLRSYSRVLQLLAEDLSLNNFVFLGQGPFYGIACESMLKIKEMAISMSEAYHVLEYRHGPMAIADEHTLVTLFFSNQGTSHEEAVLMDMKKLGAKTLAICETTTATIFNTADVVIEINSGVPDAFRTVLVMLVVQLFSFYRASAKGINPDKPRHLSQVVMLKE